MIEPRPEVVWFAKQMELKLKANDHKKHWHEMHMDYLIERLYQESQELWTAIISGNASDIVQEAADVSNFAMMIADNAGLKDRISPATFTDDPNQLDMFEEFNIPIKSNVGD